MRTSLPNSAPAPAPPADHAAAAETPGLRWLRPQAKSHRDGAVLRPLSARPTAAAVFVRGLTAWIVLQDSPALDVKKLKSMLRNYPAGMEATVQDGVAVLRVD